MKARTIIGMALAVGSCWPVYKGLAQLAEKDYLAAFLALALAWLVARTGLELVMMADASDAPITRTIAGRRHAQIANHDGSAETAASPDSVHNG